jgi:DNA-binding HxlR family transcriptional regulator
MKKMSVKRDTGCPVTFGLDVFGDKWSLLIIRDLMLHRRKTFKEFSAAGEGIASNILADRLKQLEAEKILRKSPDPGNGRSYIYTLTEKGRDLAPIIIEMICWSGKYDQRPHARKGTLKKVRANRAGFEAEIRSKPATGRA